MSFEQRGSGGERLCVGEIKRFVRLREWRGLSSGGWLPGEMIEEVVDRLTFWIGDSSPGGIIVGAGTAGWLVGDRLFLYGCREMVKGGKELEHGFAGRRSLLLL